MPKSADYAIIGAGTAGCILASRLSEDPSATVVLLECGAGDSSPAIWDKTPSAMFRLWAANAPENWGYATTEQRGLYGRVIPIPRGKVLGGCSAINAMIYIRGNRRDFDSWHRLGNRGWSYEEVLPLFRRSEAYRGRHSAYHGYEGPVSVIDYGNPSPVSHAFIEAAAELGAGAKYNDLNGMSQEAGAGFYQSTRTSEGVRVTAASAFLGPILQRRNLRLMTSVRATRILFHKTRAVAVEYFDSSAVHRLERLHVEREIVLCCGAFETPKLMMLSGLGPEDQLARHRIAMVRPLVGVGTNLQDHLMVGVGFGSKIPLAVPELLAEAGLFTWTDTPSEDRSPDLQYFFSPIQFLPPEYVTDRPGFTCAPVLTQPLSRGAVTLASSDATVLARIDMGYLTREKDIAVLEYGIRYARELTHTKPFEGMRGRELAPGSEIAGRGQLYDFIRKVATTVWHPCGTCKMGADQKAVVDDELRVHGIDGLRIADASVMPTIVNGNPNAAVMMIAERAAELIAPGQRSIAHRPSQPGAKDVDRVLLSNPEVGCHYPPGKGATPMPTHDEVPRALPELKFAAAVALRFDAPRTVGETPDGVRFDFMVHGTVEGPLLNGNFPHCAAYLLIDPDGVGTIHVRAPLLLNDGAVAELEATGRYDFGKDGYRRALANDLPNSALGWCPRFLTGHPRYLWLNRALCVGVGELRPRETRVDYDLFIVSSPAFASAPSSSTAGAPPRPTSPHEVHDAWGERSLYERLGGRKGIYRLMSASIDSLHDNDQLNRQNPKLAAAKTRTNPADLKDKVTAFICRLTGGSCAYTGRTMKASHAPLDITESDWRVFVDDFVKVMTECGIPQREQRELLALMDTTKAEIVRSA